MITGYSNTGYTNAAHTVARNWSAIPAWRVATRERTMSWLAFGLLLAAWNFSDNDAVTPGAARPPRLENHAFVTVRAARDYAN
jgi:hypothetical protein